MSLEAVKSKHGARVVLGSLLGSAAILAVSWWGLGREEPAAAVTPEPPAQASLVGGVQAAAVDSARWNPDPADGDDVVRAAAVQVPTPAPTPGLELVPVRREVPAERLAQQAADLAADAETNRLLAERQAGPTAALQAALAGRRAALARECMAGDGPVTLSVQARFDADGSMMGHSVSGEPWAVAECVGRQPFTLEIPASDAGVAVTADLRLP